MKISDIQAEGHGSPGHDKDNSTEQVDDKWFSWRIFFTYTGPGCLIAIAYLDPGNLEADLQAGAYAKYSLEWVLLLSLAAGLVLQAMSLRIGIFTGKHLAQLCREEYSPATSLLLWACAEVSIVTCDMQAIITSAIAFRILFGLPLWAGCLLTFTDVLTFLLLELKQWHSIDRFFVFLVAVMAICFFWNVGVNPPDSSDVLLGMVVPRMSYHSFAPAVAIIGSIILPQNFFIHSGLVAANSQVDRSSDAKMKEANKYMLADTSAAIMVACLINLAVTSCFAEIFFSPDCAGTPALTACVEFSSRAGDIDADDVICENSGGGYGLCEAIGLSEADSALAGALGPTAQVVWACGLLASAQSSTMTITYTGQFIVEGFLEIKLPLYWRVLFCRSVALVPALLAALGSAAQPSLLDATTEWGNIVASICVPFSVIPMLKFTASRALMGDNVLGSYTRLFIWSLTVFLVFTNVYLIWEYMFYFQVMFVPSMFVPVLCLLTIMYLLCVYHIGREDINSCVRHCAQHSDWICGGGDKLTHRRRRSIVPNDDPDLEHDDAPDGGGDDPSSILLTGMLASTGGTSNSSCEGIDTSTTAVTANTDVANDSFSDHHHHQNHHEQQQQQHLEVDGLYAGVFKRSPGKFQFSK